LKGSLGKGVIIPMEGDIPPRACFKESGMVDDCGMLPVEASH